MARQIVNERRRMVDNLLIVNYNCYKVYNRRCQMKTRDLTQIAILVALMAICSWITIPTVVPFTLQTLGVFLAISLLGGKRGTLAVLIYLLLGAVGLPVFAGFASGPAALLGTTGGYILGFLAQAAVMWTAEHFLGRRTWVFLLSGVLGLAVCYLLGSVWFLFLYSRTTGPVGMLTVLGWCVFPFVLPDLAKLALATALGRRLAPALGQPAR